MVWVWVVVIVVLAGGVVVVAVGRGGSMTEVYDDRPDTTIPSGRPISADDLREVRFTTAVRGYRMDEVDTLLARLRADLLARETREAEQAATSDAEPVPGREPLAGVEPVADPDPVRDPEPEPPT